MPCGPSRSSATVSFGLLTISATFFSQRGKLYGMGVGIIGTRANVTMIQLACAFWPLTCYEGDFERSVHDGD